MKFVSFLVSSVVAQQVREINSNALILFVIGECTADGSCNNTKTKLSLDSSWRWTHEVDGSKNCYTQNEWRVIGPSL